MNRLARRALNTSRIPRDLAAVTQIDRGAEVAPDSLGLSPDSVGSIWNNVERLYRTGVHPGIQLCLRYRGEIVLQRAIGHAHGNGPRDNRRTPPVAMTTRTPICYFSASKAVTALLMHLLAEQGRVNLLDPVSHYCPEFGRNGKATITLHQILSHRGGIPAIPRDTPLETLWDRDAIWKILCDAVPVEVDGSKLAYHAITGGFVLQRVLETVTGESIETFLDRHIRQPLGMTWFTYGIRQEKRAELASNYATGPSPVFPVSWVLRRALGGDIGTIESAVNDPRFLETVVPAANLCGTAEEMNRFFQMMLDEGAWNGQRICQPETIRRAVQQFGSPQIDRTLMIPMRFSAGFMLGGNPGGLWGPDSGDAFGHVGLINKLCWADPSRDISVTLLNTGLPIVAHHLPALVRFVWSVGRQFPRHSRESRRVVA
ncbi:class A beta-lactamase-related serine hydrolase [Marinobacter halodurans]|uniref:Class A beta-lactamase-related serine hydrolase n=1 Tax=Marinobacter halodurans TaxID=2528979 RepID=A0ABY1ZIB4_9GAMM|nr:serine hydrolase domain-containing protein [Marinobacter halodurans]TBW49808.1 class A beta-lactamase-related serine hydrolase [Marinobacter halodurans]